MKIKRVQHVSIPVPPGAADRVRAFYGGILGLAEKQVPSALDSDQLTWFAIGDDEHEIHCFADPDVEHRSSAAHLCLEVDDIDALRKRIVDCGVDFDTEPAEIHNRPRCFVRDPFGNLIEFTQIFGRYDEE